MGNTMKRKKRRRRGRSNFGKILTFLSAFLLSVGAFCIEAYGGQYGVPTWEDLYTALGIPMNGPDAELLAASETTVTLFDVGQGDAVLIGQDGNYCLIDTGTAESQQDLVRGLRRAGVQELQYLVLTHPHADHTGGVLAVLENFQVEKMLLPVWIPEEETASQWPYGMEELAYETGVSITETVEGDRYILGSGTIQVLLGGNADTGNGDANHASLCLLFEAGDFRYLCTGDAEQEEERKLVDRYGNGLQAVVYKAGHHGSSTSSSQELLQVVQPQVAFISCGMDNDYGHPHMETLRSLEACGAQIFRTDTMGSVTLTWQNDRWQAWTFGEMQAAA